MRSVIPTTRTEQYLHLSQSLDQVFLHLSGVSPTLLGGIRSREVTLDLHEELQHTFVRFLAIFIHNIQDRTIP